jgi:hypothetical protein
MRSGDERAQGGPLSADNHPPPRPSWCVIELAVLISQCADNWKGKLGNAIEEEMRNVTFVREEDT